MTKTNESSTSENPVQGCLAALVVFVIGLPLASVLYAWAAMLNWNWFVTSLGIPRIGFFQAYGLSLVVSSFTSSNGAQNKKDERSIVEMAVMMFIYIFARFAFFAGLGYAVHLLMVAK